MIRRVKGAHGGFQVYDVLRDHGQKHLTLVIVAAFKPRKALSRNYDESGGQRTLEAISSTVGPSGFGSRAM